VVPGRDDLDAQGRCPLCREACPPLDAVFTWGAYDGVLRRLIQLYKYERIRSLRRPLSRWIAEAVPRHPEFELITFVPMSFGRRWERGFNQSHDFARAAARASGLPMHPCLTRAKRVRPQAGLTESERRANLRGVFRLHSRAALEGKAVLVVDDVMTTGATAYECAKVLKAGGAQLVGFLALARAGLFTPTREVLTAGTNRPLWNEEGNRLQ
jgi:ComF family protein